MPLIRLLFCLFLSLASLPPLAAPAATPEALRIAIVNSYGTEITGRYYSDSIETIRAAVSPRSVRLLTYGPEEFLRAADRGEFDISIASSGLTSLMISRTSGIPLLTIASDLAPDPNFGNGVAIIVPEDSPIRQLTDLRDKHVAIMSESAFAGWQIPMVEFIRHGIDPAGFLGKTTVTGAPMTQIVELVAAGEADAGFIVTCLLEGLQDEGNPVVSKIRVINEQPDKTIACRHSSALYPNWLLTVKPSVSTSDAREITRRLLALPAGVHGTHWTVPTDHRRIYQLFETLQMPLKNEASLGNLMRTYWPWIAGGFVAFLTALGNAVLLALLVRRRTREAERALKEKMMSDMAAKESAMKLESLSKASAVGLLSSMVAHELKQPLTVIANYAGSLRQRYERGDTVPLNTVRTALDEILRSNLSASAIVEKIRAYARPGSPRHFATPLTTVTNEAVNRFQQNAPAQATIRLTWNAEPVIDMDPLELGLVATNLVKNAVQAAVQIGNPCVLIEIDATEHDAFLRVSDNGPELTDEAVSRIGTVGVSSKRAGLGLGVAIIRSLLERHAASLTYEKRTPCGLTAVVKFPLISQGSKA